MFSLKQKQQIASGVEKLLLDIGHPEMSKEKPYFQLHVEGNSPMSWADILPNHTYDENNKPGVNPHNEHVANVMEKEGKDADS